LDDYIYALQLTVISLGALLLISICFIGLTRGLQWLAGMGRKEEEVATAEPEAPIATEVTPSVTQEATAHALPTATKQTRPLIAGEGVVTSPMPGTVLSIEVQVGAQVKRGDVLLIVESMKIQNDISAPKDGRVKEIHVVEGAYVRRREPLLTIEE
jgi:biotin carboxyl carrier protein